MSARVAEIGYDRIAHWRRPAARERVSLSESAGARWWGVFDGEHLNGAASLMPVRIGYRLRAVYVTPAQRGKGYGQFLTQALLELCEQQCAGVEVFAYNPAFYERLGFTRVGTLPNGAAKLRRMY